MSSDAAASQAAASQAAASPAAAANRPAVSGGVATPGGTEIGWRLRRDPLMLVMVVSTAVVIAAIGGINVIEVFFIRETLEGSATTYGLVSAAWMAGMLPGTWLAVRLARRLDDDAGLVRGVLATLAVCSLMVLLASTVPAAGVLVPLWLVGGAANGGENVFANLLTARRVPEAMRARAYASYGAAVQGGSMAGFLIGGALLAVVPPRPLIAGAGVVGLLVVLVFVPFVTRAVRRSSSAGLATPGRPAEPEPAAGDTVGPWLSASHARGSGTSSS
ncbi:hypothetical protein GUI43_05223 [Micromonospora noduli]|nr:hypothetical protein GUI43_05223 [Micromonospora noduli]